jgi:Zn-dependent protease
MTFALVLNLLPVPGLDGFGVIRPWLSFQLQYSLMRYGTLAILGVYVVLWFVAPVRDVFFRLIFQVTSLAGIPLDLIFVGLFNMRIVQ